MASEEKKMNFFKRTGIKISTYFREMKAELKKVVWPTFKQVRNNTGVVITALILVGVIVAVLDLGFSYLMSVLLG